MPFFNNKISNFINVNSNNNYNNSSDDSSDDSSDNDSNNNNNNNNKYIYNDETDLNNLSHRNNTNHKTKNTKQSKKTITIYEYNPDRQYEISINKFLEIINNIPTSSNAIDICKYINPNLYSTDIPLFESIATRYSVTYKNIFNGNNTSYFDKSILDIINCDINPKINKKTFNSIKYIKMKIHEFSNKKIYDALTAEWIGLLSGLVMYFNDLDDYNFKKTNFSNDIKTIFTIKDL